MNVVLNTKKILWEKRKMTNKTLCVPASLKSLFAFQIAA